MKITIIPAILVLALIGCKEEPKKETLSLNYPQTKKVDTVDTYFGVEVKDSYRWLEDDRSPETEEWVKEQNKVTYDYLNTIPFRAELKERLSGLCVDDKVGAPFQKRVYTYVAKNNCLQSQIVLYS